MAEAANLYNLPRFSTDPEVDAGYRPYELAGIAFYMTHAPNLTYENSSYK